MSSRQGATQAGVVDYHPFQRYPIEVLECVEIFGSVGSSFQTLEVDTTCQNTRFNGHGSVGVASAKRIVLEQLQYSVFYDILCDA